MIFVVVLKLENPNLCNISPEFLLPWFTLYSNLHSYRSTEPFISWNKDIATNSIRLGFQGETKQEKVHTYIHMSYIRSSNQYTKFQSTGLKDGDTAYTSKKKKKNHNRKYGAKNNPN